MYTLTVQSLEAKPIKTLSQPTLQFSQERSLTARWIMEDGRLVCRWVLIQA